MEKVPPSQEAKIKSKVNGQNNAEIECTKAILRAIKNGHSSAPCGDKIGNHFLEDLKKKDYRIFRFEIGEEYVVSWDK